MGLERNFWTCRPSIFVSKAFFSGCNGCHWLKAITIERALKDQHCQSYESAKNGCNALTVSICGGREAGREGGRQGEREGGWMNGMVLLEQSGESLPPLPTSSPPSLLSTLLPPLPVSSPPLPPLLPPLPPHLLSPSLLLSPLPPSSLLQFLPPPHFNSFLLLSTSTQL